MKKKLQTLQQLLALMDPELYRHFGLSMNSDYSVVVLNVGYIEKTDSLNLFFCFR